MPTSKSLRRKAINRHRTNDKHTYNIEIINSGLTNDAFPDCG